MAGTIASAATRGSESYGKEGKKREGKWCIRKWKGTCKFESYEREKERERAKRRKKNVWEDLLKKHNFYIN